MPLRGMNILHVLLASCVWSQSLLMGGVAWRINYDERPCGASMFEPRTHSCCGETVINIPQKDCRCCDGACRGMNEVTSCTSTCNGTLYHPETQLCCRQQILLAPSPYDKCCGDTVIHSYDQRCCGVHSDIIVDSKNYGCCGYQKFPYHILSMRCGPKSSYVKKVTMRGKAREKFRSQAICSKELPPWDMRWPLPGINNTSRIHIRGIPDLCSVDIESRKIHLSFSLFALRGQTLDPRCADSTTLKVTIKLGPRAKCSTQDVQEYLQGVGLDLYSKRRVQCREDGRPELVLKDLSNAVVFRASHPRDLIVKSLELP